MAGLTGRTQDVRSLVVGRDTERDATGSAVGGRGLFYLAIRSSALARNVNNECEIANWG